MKLIHKFIFCCISLFLFTVLLSAQTPPAVQQDLMSFEPGELIVKLKDNVDAGITYAENGKAVSSFNIGELLSIEDKVASSNVMFHQKGIEASISNSQRLKAVYEAKAAANPNNGYTPKEPLTMKNVFVLKTFNAQENILQLIEQIKDDPNVEYAEPNYIYGIDDFEVGEIITAEEASKMTASNSSSTIEVNDPLYSSQSNITSTNIDDVWDQYTTGDGSQVIAILDTGGDYTHPDLAANTWINAAELNGVEGYDDDGNGYIDDIRGWDFINLDNAPLDDNMHGTHVAGIAGAVGNNGIGIAGAAWNVKLMHIKVFQSTGQGNSTNIAAGVEYASSNGATIINMSFGSYAASYTMKIALENAYSTSYLVAAAGNNNLPIGFETCITAPPSPYYPAAYSYVFGVMDVTCGYSNNDLDGPIATDYPNLLNYELHAPGTNIMSTIPNGGYATLTGTSMASPLVAGGLALYLEINTEQSKELTFGSLIFNSNYFVDFLTAMETEPVSKLYVISKSLRDTINNQNGNTIIEPGETIEIIPLIKNFWGPTNDVRVGISFAEFEDDSKATIIQNEIQIGSITAYAALEDLEETLKITIADNVANNVDIKFVLTVWSGPDQDYMSEEYEFNIKVVNAIIFSDYITEDLTLTNDKEWIFQNSMVVANGATVTIEAGTTVKLSNLATIIVDENSYIFSNGTSENPVTIKSSEGYWRGVTIQNSQEDTFGFRFKYDDSFKYGSSESATGLIESVRGYPPVYEYFSDIEELKLHDIFSRAIFKYTNFKNWGMQITGDGGGFYGPAQYENCQWLEFDQVRNFGGGNIVTDSNIYYGMNNGSTSKSGIEDLTLVSSYGHGGSNLYDWYRGVQFGILKNVNVAQVDFYGVRIPYDIPLAQADNFFYIAEQYDSNKYYSPWYLGTSNLNFTNIKNIAPISSEDIQEQYSYKIGTSSIDAGIGYYPYKTWLGSTNLEILKDKFWTYDNSQNFPGLINWDNIPNGPFEENHGIVWKVLVNGKDAQDEYALMDPIGVGPHEFKVYFNRAMDTSVNPQISYGVTIPYNQKIISETGTWSADGKIYTVNHEVNIGTADGINRIRVQDAQDLDNFKIPVEDFRFNMLVQSAGSASTGFFATAGLGEISLEWEAPDANEIDDALGYNMYRYQVDTDGVDSTPVKLNESLIIEDSDENTTGIYYSDFNVVEGQTYFYKYKILRTSFEETDYSQTVSSAPLTSTLGDSNGDFTVDVLDLVHDVDYILGNNPEPFIFLAGDVNADETINVLDIVGTVDIILNPSSTSDINVGSNDIQFYPSEAIGTANFTWEGNDLYVASNFKIGGIQLAFNTDFEYVLSEELPTIEHLDYTQEDSKILMLYSFNNTVIASSKTKILTRQDASQEFDIEQAVVGTTSGAKLNAVLNSGVLSTIDAPFQNKNLQFLNLYPNPAEGVVNLEYYLPNQMDQVVAKVYDLLGRLVHIQVLENKEGISKIPMELNRLKTGNYIVLITANKRGSIKNIANKKLIVK